jgi:hypothetical protein
MIVAPPSSGKTEILNILYGLPNTFEISTFTEGALLSGTSKKDQDKGATGGLLRTIGDFGIIVCKDFTTVLSMSRDPRSQAIAALREIYDGRWTRLYGSGGGRTDLWEGKVGLIGAVTPAIDSHFKVISSMGERFLMCRMESDVETSLKQADKAISSAGAEGTMREELRTLAADLFNDLHNGVQLPEASPTLVDHLKSLSTLVAHCRTTVERSGYGREIEYIHAHESPPRLAKQLLSVFQGCVLIGCTAQEAWSTAMQLGFDSMPPLRRRIIKLLHSRGEMCSSDVSRWLRCPEGTVKKRLEDLFSLQIIEKASHSGSNTVSWRISEVHDSFIDGISQPLESTEELFVQVEEQNSEKSVHPCSTKGTGGLLTFRKSPENTATDGMKEVSA